SAFLVGPSALEILRPVSSQYLNYSFIGDLLSTGITTSTLRNTRPRVKSLSIVGCCIGWLCAICSASEFRQWSWLDRCTDLHLHVIFDLQLRRWGVFTPFHHHFGSGFRKLWINHSEGEHGPFIGGVSRPRGQPNGPSIDLDPVEMECIIARHRPIDEFGARAILKHRGIRFADVVTVPHQGHFLTGSLC